MTDREAIKALKLEGGLEISGKPGRAAEFLEGLSVAESALQEREERSKGCEFCNTYDFGRCGIDEHRIFMAGGNSRVDANEQFKFCPRCGRPLKGAQDESICM